MTIPKYRAAILVFLVGFTLGLSVFVASRLFVRSVLSNDAIIATETLAEQLAEGRSIQASGALSSVIRYTYFDLAGKVVASGAPGGDATQPPVLSEADFSRLSGLMGAGGAVVEEASLLSSLFGLAESATKRVAVPVVSEGRMLGTLFVEVDQTQALESLTRAFSVVGMVTVGLAVLAVIAVAFVVTRGTGFGRAGVKAFDPALLPRDPLTDVPTRSGLALALEDSLERAAASDQQVGLMIVGLDGFRAVNDIWGHTVGDEVLRITAERLKPFGAGAAGVARVAGDEFAVILEGDTNTIRPVADKIREALGEPFLVNGSSILLGASIGAALYPINAESGQILFRAADSALSRAKTKGRNSLAVFDTEMKEKLQRNAALERDLRNALSRNEFVVFYQPQLELASGRLRGYEALVRWERPGEGILSPRDFLSVAEETGLIRPIGDWVLRKACEDAASWLDSGTVAVNFSAAQFRTPDVDAYVAKVLKETGLAPERLEIEVPETLFLDDFGDMMETLKRIKALGVRVAMDDFGSGYSGLASLARFPFDKIKIDRNFVSQLAQDADVAAIVAAIVALGRTLSVDVTAEGVETSEQVTLLKAAGCSIVQGFLFGVPKREATVSLADGAGQGGISRDASAGASGGS